MPAAMQHLPLSELGYLKPWFVKGGDLREIDDKKYISAMKDRHCWVCGGINQQAFTFVTDIRYAYNSVSLEPPCHDECARYSAMVCPHLLLPKSKRREADLPDRISNENINPMINLENPGKIVLTYVTSFDFVWVEKSNMAKWRDQDVRCQELWVEGEIVFENKTGPLDKRLLVQQFKES